MTTLERLRAERRNQGLDMVFSDDVLRRIAAVVIGGRR